jgi:hypothetical protein
MASGADYDFQLAANRKSYLLLNEHVKTVDAVPTVRNAVLMERGFESFGPMC